MKKIYYVYYPRNFVNEFTVYYVNSALGQELINKLDAKRDESSDLHRVTTRQIRKLCHNERVRMDWGRPSFAITTPQNAETLISQLSV